MFIRQLPVLRGRERQRDSSRGEFACGIQNINVKTGLGAVGYFNEQIRQNVDEKTRNCMKPYVDQIIAVILEQPLPGSIQKLGWISADQTIAQAQLTLKGRQTSWQLLSDGRQTVAYGSLMGGVAMRTTVFFDFDGKAYFARSTLSSGWDRTEGYSGGGHGDQQGVDPNELCGNLTNQTFSYLQGVLGPAKQPPSKTGSRIEPAWNITGGAAGYCGKAGTSTTVAHAVVCGSAPWRRGLGDAFAIATRR